MGAVGATIGELKEEFICRLVLQPGSNPEVSRAEAGKKTQVQRKIPFTGEGRSTIDDPN